MLTCTNELTYSPYRACYINLFQLISNIQHKNIMLNPSAKT